jgi:hypothetical protein
MKLKFIFVILLVHLNVFANEICGSEKWGAVKFDYCFYPGSGDQKNNLLYYFSGVTNDERGWLEQPYPKSLQKHWKKSGLSSPSVLNIAVGKIWFAVAKNSSANSGKLELIVNNMDSLESKFFPIAPQQRWIMGDSMGGHNMWQLVFSRPDHFSKVVSMCAAIMAKTPYMTEQELQEYTKLSGGNWISTKSAQELYQAHYPSTEVWLQSNPLGRVLEARTPTRSKHLIISVPNDMFSFTPGSSALASLLTAQGESVERFIIPGGHCRPRDVEKVTNFLLRE